jgi:hypothetical protein
MNVPPPNISDACEALELALNTATPVSGDCEKVAAMIALLQTWYSEKCPIL